MRNWLHWSYPALALGAALQAATVILGLLGWDWPLITALLVGSRHFVLFGLPMAMTQVAGSPARHRRAAPVLGILGITYVVEFFGWAFGFPVGAALAVLHGLCWLGLFAALAREWGSLLSWLAAGAMLAAGVAHLSGALFLGQGLAIASFVLGAVVLSDASRRSLTSTERERIKG